MKTYQSHKKVQAAKIIKIVEDAVSVLVLEDSPSQQMPYSWMTKHNPKVGGYLVRYEDGYESFSPAKAFEEGYTECK